MVEIVDRKPDRNGDPMISTRIHEKNDYFYARFYGDAEHVERVRVTLEAAKAERRPVIILAKVSVRLDNSESDLAIYGQEVHVADDILAQERTGDILIQLNAGSIKPSLEAQKAVRIAKDAVKNGQEPESHVQEVMESYYPAAIEHKKGILQKFIASARNDDDKNSVGVVIQTICGDKTENLQMPGRYVIDQSVENSIKATDGVVSVKEAH